MYRCAEVQLARIILLGVFCNQMSAKGKYFIDSLPCTLYNCKILCIGNKVYIGFPENYNNAPEFLIMHMSTNEVDAVEFLVDTLKGFHFRNTVTNNDAVQVQFPLQFEVQNYEQRYNGIKVTTANDEPLVVYGESYSSESAGIFAALPCSAQNVTEYEYYGVTFNGFTSHSRAFMLFVGCENSTIVRVGSLIVYLHEMERYIYSSTHGLTGTRVVSNKPISFISGHQCRGVPPGESSCDQLVEQLPNTALWGKEFLTAPLFGRTAPDIYIVVSYLPSTVTTMVCSDSSNTTVTTLSQFPRNHKVVTVPDSAYCSIDSNNPVLVVQFASSGEADNTSSDPFMMNIPPVDQYTNKYVVVIPAEFSSNVITIFVTPEYYQPERIFVDEVNQNDANWTDIPCQNDSLVCGYAATIVVDEGQHRVFHESTSAKMSVSVYGFSRDNGYGYYAVGDLKLDYYPSQDSSVSPSLLTTVASNVTGNLWKLFSQMCAYYYGATPKLSYFLGVGLHRNAYF